MSSKKQALKATDKKRTEKYEKPFTVNASFEDIIKIAVTPKEDLKKEDFGCKKS
jgi:hypothetical protein